MKHTKLYTLIIIFLLTSSIGFAQSKYSSLNYSMGLPTGDLADYIEDASFRGLTFSFRSEVNEMLMLGVKVGYNAFYEDSGYKTATDGNTTISGRQYRYEHVVPIYFTIGKQFLEDDFRPYINLGIGTSYIDRETDIGVFAFKDDTWQFSLNPELGFVYWVYPGFGLNFGVSYYANFKNDTFDAQNYVGIQAGISFYSR
ncbi:outer membrane beta-barrel protein [Marinigracilibium pacificum]|uniref:Outer membrane beta-barrel protein n=1 Tax=Marinigracilibium pacificum TaxID=2729599 RepID=A0A848J177_9BACT|nr:outer membrane beta-barrel protein [Marinigracilibium pacificum]NMM48234.1 outer membrane beta-barrel protein [Marinigracilibium pacificum]